MQTNYQTTNLMDNGILQGVAAAEVRKPVRQAIVPSADLAGECLRLTQLWKWEEVAWMGLGASALALLALSFT